MRHFAALVAAVVAVLAAPRTTSAAACCGEASALGERLLDGEAAAATVRVSARGRFGSFDGDGAFSENPPETVDAGVSVALGTAARVTEQLEIGAELSGQLNARSAGGESFIGGGFSDMRAHARFAIVSSTAHRYAPGVFATVGAVIPTGTPASRAEPGQLGADVTGQGNAELVLGASLEKAFEDVLVVRAEGSLGWFVPETVGAERLARSPRLGVGGLVGPVFDPCVFGVGFSYEAEAAPPGAPPETTGRSKAELYLVGTLDLNRRTTLIAALRSALPIDGFGTNELGNTTGTLGVRLGFFP